MPDVLTIEGLQKTYDRKLVLKGLTLAVAPGQVFGLLGPNGSGKTTTLGIVLGAIRAGAGRYAWFGQGASARERRRIGALLEQPCFYPWLSGKDNLAVIAAVKGLPAGAADDPLRTVGLWDVRAQAFETFSLGMKQRLGIAAALLGKPEVLVLDEPTNGVDAQGIYEIRSIISGLARNGCTVILASHMLDEVEKVCSHLAILKEGQVLKTGAIGSVLSTSGWLELGAAELDGLERQLRSLEPAARIERRGALLEVYDAKLSPGELNARLASRGVVLEHLARRQPSLESHYLELVGSEAPA